jgi:UDP-N-acetylmuramoylalanine--D-glutamate ligase
MKQWTGKHVLIIGAARQGTALARYLAERGAAVTLNDRQPEETLSGARASLSDLSITWVLGGHPLEILDGVDLVAVSGGVPLDLPLVREARNRNIPLTNDSQIFMDAVPCPVIGITGSAGKTTTTTLVCRMLEAEFGSDRTWVGGNIGNPLICDVVQMNTGDWVVLELSSFQLELMNHAPHIAAVLNITPNHLDRHGTMQAYTAAKARIVQNQSADDIAVLGCEDPGAWKLRSDAAGHVAAFGLDPIPGDFSGTYLLDDMLVYRDGKTLTPLFPRHRVSLRGEHNLLNVLAACAIALQAGAAPASLEEGVAGFQGVEHRLEFVRSWHGTNWYNDSIATAPERAIAALEAFNEPLVLLAGGRDKDLPWSSFASLILEKVRHAVLFGEARFLVRAALEKAAQETNIPMIPFTLVPGMKEAVQAAARAAQKGDVVLLSPGGTSFDEFQDFAERGEQYRTWVAELE